MIQPYRRPATERGVFRALLWKEWREGARSAGVAFLIVAGALWFSNALDASQAGIAFVEPSFPPSLFTFTSALAALLLGRALVAHESRGDDWGFLTHRPVTRSTLFWGKAVAGATLYLVAAGLPLLASLVWLATPGHRAAPFDLRMALPAIADLLCGLVYYFLSLAIGVREARWFGSRALPIGGGLIATLLVTSLPTFAAAMAAIVVAVSLAAICAHGMFVAGGQYETQPKASRVALAVNLGSGMQIALVLATALIGVAFSRSTPFSGEIRSSEYVVAANGTIVHVVGVFHLREGRKDIREVTDLSGKPSVDYADSASRASLDRGVSSTGLIAMDPHGEYGLGFRNRSYRGTGAIFVPLLSNSPLDRQTAWYYIRREHLIAGYDVHSARQIGWMGPDGFVPGAAPPAHRFPGALDEYAGYEYVQSLLAFPTAVYRIDLDRRTIGQVFTPPPGEAVIGAAGWVAHPSSRVMMTTGSSASYQVNPDQEAGVAPFDAFVTNRAIYVQAADGSSALRVPRDAASDRATEVKVTRVRFAPGAPTFLWFMPDRQHSPFGGSMPDLVERVDGTGTIAARFALPLDTSYQRTVTSWPAVVAAGIATPVGERIVQSAYERLSPSPMARRPPLTHSDVVEWVVAAVTSVIAAIIALLVAGARGFDRRRSALWVALSVVFGATGLLSMLALVDRPAREPCPTCREKRVVTRSTCEHCGATWPEPVQDGTEIFELIA